MQRQKEGYVQKFQVWSVTAFEHLLCEPYNYFSVFLMVNLSLFS